jgi:NifB/MoaA-like Fe-S oxidoreductase
VLVTGALARAVLGPVAARLNLVEGLQVTLLPVANRFFGTTVTVAGLLTGQDIRAALKQSLKGLPQPDLVVVPAAALKDRHLFLDDTTCTELAAAVGCPVVPAAEPRELVAALGVKLERRTLNRYDGVTV